MMISPAGMPASHGGLSARLRDLARFGEIFTADDALGVVSASHLADLASDRGVAFDAAQSRSSPGVLIKTFQKSCLAVGHDLG